VSEVWLGTMTFGAQCREATSSRILDVAVAAGVNFLNTVDVHPLGGDEASRGRTEEILGRCLRQRGGRQRIILATKCRGRMGPGRTTRG
jgi:aryl-alcohol dehydrogenase-like predicted oxidoreductase